MRKSAEVNVSFVNSQITGLLAKMNAEGTNKKSKAGTIRILNKLLDKHGDIVRNAGYDRPEGEVGMQVRVFSFGCLTGPKVEVGGATDAATRQMRLRDDFYNALVERSRPLYATAIQEMLKGGNFRKGHTIETKITTLFNDVRQVRKESFGKSQPVKQTADIIVKGKLAEITLLREQRKALEEGIRTDLRAFRTTEVFKTRVKAMQDIASVVRKEYADKGLFWMNYNPTVQEFTDAFKATFKDTRTIFSGLRFRYQNRDGTYPLDLPTWEKWDGCGRLTIALAKNSQPLTKMVDGSHTYLTWRKFGEADKTLFPELAKLDTTRNTSQRIHIVRFRLQKQETGKADVWASIPVVIHRAFPDDCLIAGATVTSRIVGFRHKYSINFSVKEAIQPLRPEGDVVKLHIAFNKAEGTFGRITREDSAGVPSQSGLEPVDLSWVAPDGNLSVNLYIPEADRRCKYLNDRVNEHTKRANDLVSHWLTGNTVPPWFDSYNLGVATRRQMRRACHIWIARLVDEANTQKAQSGKKLLVALSSLRRQAAKDVHEDWDKAVGCLAFKLSKQVTLRPEAAELLAILMVFTERYEHLYPWAVNLREKAMRRRKDDYRCFAKHILQGAKEVYLPVDMADPRVLSDEQKTVARFELIQAIKQRAAYDGVKVTLQKQQSASISMSQ